MKPEMGRQLSMYSGYRDKENYLCDVTESARLYAAHDTHQFYILEEPTADVSLRLYDIEKSFV